jgi:hypothetical protein
VTEELANPQQLRFLLSLHAQLGIATDPRELATLTKWQAAERISALRGRPAPTPDVLDEALKAVLAERVELLGEDLPTDAIRMPTEPDAPASRG